MEIIHLILGKANPNRMNGVNKVVNSLASHQAALGFNVSVWGITSSPEHNYPERNYKTELFPSLRNKLSINRTVRNRIKALHKGSVMHLHGGFIPEFYHVSKVLKKTGIKYVLTPHGAYNHIAMERNKWKKKAYFTLFEKYVASNAHALHCIGQSEVDEIETLMDDKQSVLIPNGQNLNELHHKLNTSAKHHPVFGFCGRIDIHTKGLDHLLEGFASYIHVFKGHGELWIIGDGSEMPALKQMVEDLNITESVKFWGKCFGEEKLQLMSSMDVFYHPSRNEGLPGAVLEAAGLQVPCVVSHESNMAGYVNDFNAGIGLKSNDKLSVAQSMKDMASMIEKGEISVLKRNALKMVEQEFDWSRIAKRLLEVYKGK